MDYTWILQFFLLLFLLMKLRGEDLYCTVNTNITFKFVVDPPDKTAIWRRTTDELRDVGINAAGDGCSPPGLTSPPGYEYDCKTVNNTSVYILKFKSNSADDGIVYHLQGISPTQSITYKPYTSNTGALSHTNCRNTENFDVLVCKVYCNCIKSSLSWKYITQNQTETSFTIMDNDPIPCGTGVENFYKLDINVTKDVIEEVLEKKKLTGQVNVTGTLTIGDENYYFTTTLNTNASSNPTTTISPSTTIDTPSITDHGPCKECVSGLPVLIACAVVMIIGIIIFLIRFMKREVFSGETWKKVLGVWLFFLIACLILLVIYIVGLEPGCCEKETCNGVAIGEIVADIIIIIVFIVLLIKLFKDEKDNKGKKDCQEEAHGMNMKSKHNQERKSDQEKTEK